jgi:hypothetical protein
LLAGLDRLKVDWVWLAGLVDRSGGSKHASSPFGRLILARVAVRVCGKNWLWRAVRTVAVDPNRSGRLWKRAW